jgi:hypothetical protein
MTHLIFGIVDMKPEARRDKRERKRKKIVGAKLLRRHAHVSDHHKDDVVML